MNEILNNLDFWSDITQRTLSAFHLSGTDDTLYEDMKDIERVLYKVSKRKLRTIKINDDKTYTRIFTDGYQDIIINKSDLTKDCYYPHNDELKKHFNADNLNYTSITSLKYLIMPIENKKIEKPSEILFFI